MKETRRDFLKQISMVLPTLYLGNSQTLKDKEDQPEDKNIYLTFDDGYSGIDRTVDALNDLGVSATFFLTGGAIRQHPDQVRWLVESGHSLKNHTFGHPYLTGLGKAGILSELERCEMVAQEIAGVSTLPFMRPPYGAVNGFVRQVALEAGYETVIWTQDTRDWAGTPAWYIAQRIKPGIVLMHTQGRSTVGALHQVVPSLLEEGYEFATF